MLRSYSSRLKNIKGAFEYFPPKTQSSISNYFEFISFESNTEIIIKNNIRLRSGISISNDKLSTQSLSNNDSEMLFFLDKGKKISIKSKSFSLDDVSISAQESHFKLYDNIDSLYHPQVEFRYDNKLNKIEVLNINGKLRNTSFYSSYFDIEFQPDFLKYNIETIGSAEEKKKAIENKK